MNRDDRRKDAASPNRVEELWKQQQLQICRETDRLFVGLMLLQWLGGIAAALFVSPRTWIGTTSTVHLHVWAAVFLGGAISSLPVYLGLKYPGRRRTRSTIAAAQVLWSVLLIHLMGGRIEAHFHVFVSLAFLSFYREWRLLIIPTTLVAVDHVVRGFWWPQSVYGVFVEEPLRWVEHTSWVLFEVMVLAASCQRSQAGMRLSVTRQAQLEATKETFEARVQDRTLELSRSELQLRASEARLQTMLTSAHDPMITIDEQGIVQVASDSVETVLGWKPEELVGQNVKIVIPEPHRSKHDGYLVRYRQTGESTLLGVPREVMAVRRDGSEFPCEITLWKVDMPDQSRPWFTGIMRDITEQKHLTGQLNRLAYFDALTELPNRTSILSSIQSAIDRKDGTHFALLFLDFDGFKLVNDGLGHDVGDELLRQIACRLRSELRGCDRVSPARLGGDEFVVLLEDLTCPADAIAVTKRLLNSLSRSYQLGSHSVYSTASIGVVTSEHTYEEACEILRDADLAMYEAKAAGKACYAVFDQPLKDKVDSRLAIETGLREAISREQLVLNYQPIVSLETGLMAGVEALLRWKHPDMGVVRPDMFIPVAEETGVIVPIGNWVIDEACRQFGEWMHALPDNSRPASLHVNVSRKQLLSMDLVGVVERALAAHAVPAECLHLEVTESALIVEHANTIPILNNLRRLGVKIDMDDFGTGYSSLSCLQDFPIDVLKIDRAFVANLNECYEHVALLHAVLTLADNLDLEVVVEGIEDTSQLAVLQGLSCKYGQGYLFSKPLPAGEVSSFAAGQYRTDSRKLDISPTPISTEEILDLQHAEVEA